ncbi:hypothetical protein BS47DRAFT_1347438 [Hydnum rufescens UP504]|uniref:Uncharacterized protein n=1 Tax=Hydnum rufescens UP504 TaxID=1448309 RepID=A0A9P6ARR3_9AGAM|nr:hypothetical protein BS47DRAFT_1347438 [Hydnum rufescens UP504]
MSGRSEKPVPDTRAFCSRVWELLNHPDQAPVCLSSIQDGGLTAFWGAADTVDGAEVSATFDLIAVCLAEDRAAQVSIGDGTGEETQRWTLERVH